MIDLETLAMNAIDEFVRAYSKGHTGADAVRRREAALCMIILKASDMLNGMDHPIELERLFRRAAKEIRGSLCGAALVSSIYYSRDEEVRE